MSAPPFLMLKPECLESSLIPVSHHPVAPPAANPVGSLSQHSWHPTTCRMSTLLPVILPSLPENCYSLHTGLAPASVLAPFESLSTAARQSLLKHKPCHCSAQYSPMASHHPGNDQVPHSLQGSSALAHSWLPISLSSHLPCLPLSSVPVPLGALMLPTPPALLARSGPGCPHGSSSTFFRPQLK